MYHKNKMLLFRWDYMILKVTHKNLNMHTHTQYSVFECTFNKVEFTVKFCMGLKTWTPFGQMLATKGPTIIQNLVFFKRGQWSPLEQS